MSTEVCYCRRNVIIASKSLPAFYLKLETREFIAELGCDVQALTSGS